MVQYVESDLCDSSTSNIQIAVFVLLLIAIWGLLYDIGSGLFSCLALFFNECEDPMCLNEA